MDSSIDTSQLLSLAGLITVIVLFCTFAILRFWPEVAQVNIHSQAVRVKELTARCDQLEGQNRLLLSKLVESSIENDKLKKRVTEAEFELATTKNELKIVRDQLEEQHIIAPLSFAKTPLLVAVGSDSILKIDYASLRGVESTTGMKFQRIDNATFDKIKLHLDRARAAGRPYDKFHGSFHSDQRGILIGGEIVSGLEFSEILRGIKVMLLAGCESSYVGDLLSVVPYVVSFTEKVDTSDAAIFARVFWTQIGLQKTPDEALSISIERSPSSMVEFVEHHW